MFISRIGKSKLSAISSISTSSCTINKTRLFPHKEPIKFTQLDKYRGFSSNTPKKEDGIPKLKEEILAQINKEDKEAKAKIIEDPSTVKFTNTKKEEQEDKTDKKDKYSGGFWFNEYWRVVGFVAGLPIVGYLFFHEVNKPQDTKDNVKPIPGKELSMEKKVLETGGNMLQRFDPVKSVHMHLCGFHFYNGDMTRQVEAHHYCNHINEDIAQCIIYDSDKSDAKLIGIEYVISEKLFKTLPVEEQPYWHSHVYEVKSGQLIAPRLPQVAENQLMGHLVQTYGKTIHTWQIDKYALPLGSPNVMMGFTKDGQIDPELITKRDNYYNISTEEKKKARESIPTPAVATGADGWRNGKTIQVSSTMKK